MKSALIAGLALLTLSLGVPAVRAETSVHDRTLRLSTIDFGYEGGLELAVERTYSSASDHVGLFGPGWGSRYETRLVAEPDGSLVVHETGCGCSTRFLPVAGKAGTWRSTGCGVQQIKRAPLGYERQVGGGKTETFLNDGRLVRIADANGNWITLNYSAGHLASVRDNLGDSLAFVHGGDGRLERVRGGRGHEASYGFDRQGRLVRATDAKGAEYRYGYDVDGRLVSEDGPDGSRLAAGYRDGLLASLRDGSGLRRYLGYQGEGWRELVTMTEDPEGHGTSVTRLVRLDRKDAQGRDARWREITSMDGRILDTEFNDAGQPAAIRDENGRSAGFRYDPLGRLVHKDSDEETVDVAYDRRWGKIVRVERRSAGKRSWATYAYDERGNLAKAANSDGRRLTLRNDDRGRILTIIDRGRRLDFTYGLGTKPRTIALAGKGRIRVDYDDTGEVTKVDSDGGPTVALQVTSMFQGLLQIVKPAAIRISLD
ncbi:MAG: DUF6531 domain-containing protein [Actinomycetota bacterium]